ncbi:hypothetical protein BASA60_006775 [Batrachochytrium salamandrivorans]|nr:hypothetical protein BASA60_006775 [Batrachochytrium salamandrivorans]
MTPFGQVPFLTINGTTDLAQSQAILCYVGTLTGLFPAADPLKAALVNQICLFVEDITQAVVVVLFTPDAESKLKAHKNFVTEKAPTMLAALERAIEKHSGGKWAVGDSLTIADLCIYYAVDLLTSDYFPEITMDTVGSKSRTAAIYQAVHAHPKVMEWNAAHKK